MRRELGFFAVSAFLLTGAAFVGCGSSSDGSGDDSSSGGNDASSDTSLSNDATSQTDTGADVVVTVDPCAPGMTYVDLDGGTHPVPPPQAFGSKMSGCPGTVQWDQRATLCAASCAPCTAAQWVAMHGSTRPDYHYWTDDNLNYSGDWDFGAECYATTHPVQDGDAEAGIPYVSACAPGEITLPDGGPAYATSPMRVCHSTDSPDPFGDQYDPLGNYCNWTRCALGLGDGVFDAGPDADPDAAPPPFDSFGGCDDNITAGTLCCCP